MAMPEAVRRAAERAEELQRQLTAPNPAEPPNPESPAAETPEQPTDSPAPAPALVVPDPSDPPTLPASDENNPWKHKYDTLQGIFNAQSRDSQNKVRQLESEVRQLKAQPATPPQAPAPAPAPQVSQKDLETYGPEMMEVIQRTARSMAESIVEDRMSKLQPVLQQTQDQVGAIGQHVYRNDHDRFFGELGKAVPDYEQVNSSKEWLEWLGAVDPLSRMPRQEYLNQAQKSLDHGHAIQLFSEFKKSIGSAPAPAATPAAPAPARPTLSPQPRTVGANTAPVPVDPNAEQRVTRQQVEQHYARATRDRSYATSPEYQAMEQRVAKAMAAGKVV